MSEAVQLAIIAAFVTLGLAVLDQRAKVRHEKGERKLDEIKKHTNGIVKQLVKVTSAASFARGRKSKQKPKPRKK